MVTEFLMQEKRGLLAVPHTVPVEHDALPIHCAGQSLSWQPRQATQRQVCNAKYSKT